MRLARRLPRRLLALPLLACALVPGLALAAQVKGRVVGVEKLLNPVWNEAKELSAHRFTFREPSPTVRSDLRNLTAYAPKEVCIAAIAEGAQPPPTLPLLVTVGGGRTTPVTLVVAAGTRVHFENRDPFPHRLYGVGQASFSPGDTASLASRDWTPPGPGRYEVRDELAPSLRAWIVVEPLVAAVAYPARDGSFTFANLAAGKYTLRGYFAGNPVGAPRAVEVGAGNLEVKDALALTEAAPAPPDKAAPGKAGKKHEGGN